MATRQERCNVCGIQVRVPLQAQTFVCPRCRSFTRRIVQPMPQNYGYGNTNTNMKMYTMSVPMPNYYPNPGTPGNGYYPRPSSMSPLVVPGRKRAVLCGVSYYGHPKSLKGSINDVRKMHDFLINTLGFPSSSVLLLTEEETDSTRIPTRYNMTMALHWLVGGCQSGDSLVFHYSGHGSQVPDTNGDEIDGYDEALCPVDYQTAGKILDDEINAIIVRPLPPGVRLHAIIDTCNSGTVLDLAYICRISPEGFYRWKDQWIPHGGYKGTSGGIAISLSACDDNQNSGDTTAFNGNASGALTYTFVNVLQNEPRLTYERLLSSVRYKVWEAQNRAPSSSPHSPQVPQLSSSQKFDIQKTPFTL